MSYLNNKLGLNLEGAKLLIDKSLYAPSIHCSYYAVFQKLKVKYTSDNGISFSDLSQAIRNDKNRNSHGYIIDEYCNTITDIRLARSIRNDIKDLKTFREQSDYENIEIDSIKGNAAFKKCSDILRALKKI